jgi:hypothetical protein
MRNGGFTTGHERTASEVCVARDPERLAAKRYWILIRGRLTAKSGFS